MEMPPWYLPSSFSSSQKFRGLSALIPSERLLLRGPGSEHKQRFPLPPQDEVRLFTLWGHGTSCWGGLKINIVALLVDRDQGWKCSLKGDIILEEKSMVLIV